MYNNNSLAGAAGLYDSCLTVLYYIYTIYLGSLFGKNKKTNSDLSKNLEINLIICFGHIAQPYFNGIIQAE